MTSEMPLTSVRAIATLSSFIASPFIGLALAHLLAPSSNLASAVSLFAFPLVLFLGMQLWLGFALIAAIAMLLKMLFKRGGNTPRKEKRNLEAPPGSFVFVPVAFFLAAAAGLITGIASRESGLVACLFAYGSTGLTFGIALWQLAKRGFLAMLEEA